MYWIPLTQKEKKMLLNPVKARCKEILHSEKQMHHFARKYASSSLVYGRRKKTYFRVMSTAPTLVKPGTTNVIEKHLTYNPQFFDTVETCGVKCSLYELKLFLQNINTLISFYFLRSSFVSQKVLRKIVSHKDIKRQRVTRYYQ